MSSAAAGWHSTRDQCGGHEARRHRTASARRNQRGLQITLSLRNERQPGRRKRSSIPSKPRSHPLGQFIEASKRGILDGSGVDTISHRKNRNTEDTPTEIEEEIL